MSIVPNTLVLGLKHCVCCHDGCDAMIIMPAGVWNEYQENNEWWFCYKGHTQHFTGKSKEQKLKDKLATAEKQLASERKRTAWAQTDLKHEKNSNRALKGVITRTKNRIKNGVCPCCNRTFVNLERHMKGQHPTYGEHQDG